jgi:hypothetical protein
MCLDMLAPFSKAGPSPFLVGQAALGSQSTHRNSYYVHDAVDAITRLASYFPVQK